MFNKFTEKQYLEIIRARDSVIGYEKQTTAVIKVVKHFNSNIEIKLSHNQALALANPVTREWAHEQFVEEEKLYVWHLKSDNDMIASKTIDSWYLDKLPILNKEFTETEIENSPFKLEWFDKEEVY